MRCRICNCTNDPSLYDELSGLTIARFYPDPDFPVTSVICTSCAEDVYGEDGMASIEANEGSEDLGLDEETEREIAEILIDLDEIALKKEESYNFEDENV